MGIAFIVGGFTQLFHAFQFGNTRRPISRFLISALSIVAGVIVLRSPVVGAEGITLVLSYYLLFGAVAKVALAVEEGRKTKGRGWLIFSAVVSFFLGVCLITTFSFSSLVIPGTILGVDLVFYGLSIMMTSGRIQQGRQIIESADFKKAG